MNLPNKLTMLRIILTPVFLAVLYWGFPGADYMALAIFIIASLTDLMVGKFADPLADKILVVAAMLWFVECGRMPAWMVMIVITREFAVSGLRMIASDNGRVIAAGWSGKVKTASTMVCIVVMLLLGPSLTAYQSGGGLTAVPWDRYISWADTVCVWVITLTTLYSGVEYFVKNKDVIQSA